MPRVGIILETPALVRVGLPILTVASYDIERVIDAAGSWVLEFPAGEDLASQVRTRWRVSIVEEGRPGYLLRRGIVTDRQFDVARDGSGVLRLAGLSRLFGLAKQSTHLGLRFDAMSIQFIAEFLSLETVIAPSIPDVATRQPSVTFNDTTNLAALLTALEYARCSIRETFDEDQFELTAWDNVPDSGFRFVTVAQGGPDLDGAAANGMGLIAGRPRIGYNGRDLATRIIPVGVDHDGNPLTLASATLSAPYAVQTGVNPGVSEPYYYLEDAAATAASELIELPLVRSDVKNPNDDPISRAQAADALYALAAGTLVQRRSDVIAFASEIANGSQIDALPGDRVRVQFRGRAAGFGGAGNYWSLDQWFLIVKRRDASAQGGVRGVSFTLTAPEVPLATPSLPEAIPIPPPPSPPPSPPYPTTDKDKKNEDALPVDDLGGAPLGGDMPPLDTPPEIPVGDLPPGGPGAYQPCCPTPTDNNGGDTPPPPDIGPEPGDIVPPEGLFWEALTGSITPENFDRWVGVCSTNNIAPSGTDLSFSALGEIFLTHGGSLDNSPPATVKLWSFRVTGPAPALSGAHYQRWARANASLEGHAVEFTLEVGSAEAFHPFPGGSSNFELEVVCGCPSLDDNKAVGLLAVGGRSGFNLEGGGASGGYNEMPGSGGIGPASVSPYVSTTIWSPDNTIPPYVCMWEWHAEIRARIVS